MMAIAPIKGQAVVMGHKCHIVKYERGGIAAVGSAFPWIVRNNPDGTLPLEQIEYVCSITPNELVVPVAGITLESSQNHMSGKVLRPDYISKVKKLAKKYKATLHLDGARSWNAAVFLGMDMKEMTKDFDLVSVCLSKGMGCPIGSLVVGSAKNIHEVRNYRKMIGGAMRQTGIFAACGLVSLMDWEEKIRTDNLNASFMAHEIAEMPGVNMVPSDCETNICRVRFTSELLKRLKLDYRKISQRLKEEEHIMCNAGVANDYIRFVTHRDVNRADCEKVVKAVKRLVTQ